MTAVTSGEFLNEFTLYADRANDENETFIIQRENGKHLVMMSMNAYNALQKELYMAKQQHADHA
ncbi:MAG: type II toxin-antitoxin system Phd/YefM family antitoxin [Schwartzia sp.]|nr:type II toxin-antitoxin system Phd/YefM family antitoxin [Schwartzia sp. (in: firmicutes)]